jgi:hypothetical protein
MIDIDNVFSTIDHIDRELSEKEKDLDEVEARLENLSSYS